MSRHDEKSLDIHKKSFKVEKRRYSIVTFMFNVYGNDIKNWRVAHSAL